MKKNYGILIIATGHHNYGRMAYNLAVSILAKDASMQIALVYNASALSHLNETQKSVFTHLIETDKKWNHLKLMGPQLSPFDRTLLLDADTLWIRDDPAEVFDLLNNRIFTCVNEGYYDMKTGEDRVNPKYKVAVANALYKKYKCTHDKFWVIRAEFILWKKCKTTDKIFSDALKVYTDPSLVEGTAAIMKNIRFAGVLPDEFAIDMGLCKNKVDPHEYQWQPTYWPHLHGSRVPPLWELNKKHYVFSFGGSVTPKSSKEMYDLIMGAACQKLGLRHIFKLQSKHEYDPTRKKF